MLSRRDFLKSLGVALAVPSLLAGIFATKAEAVEQFGVKSLDPKLLDKVGIRRLTVYIKKQISFMMEGFKFENNDSVSRRYLSNGVRMFMEDLKNRKALYEYLIVCDETNNHPDRELTLDVYYKKIYSAEYVWLKFWL